MTQGNPYPPWPGGDDRIIVQEMLRDRTSGQWYECCELVKRLVQVQAKNAPRGISQIIEKEEKAM